jgi:small subunit ribosomal protein S18
MNGPQGGGSRRPAPKPGKFRKSRRKVCIFSAEKVEKVDYKMMIVNRYRSKLLSERGKIVPRRTTGTTARFQRQVARAIKRARHMALLPFVAE